MICFDLPDLTALLDWARLNHQPLFWGVVVPPAFLLYVWGLSSFEDWMDRPTRPQELEAAAARVAEIRAEDKRQLELWRVECELGHGIWQLLFRQRWATRRVA